VDGTFGSPFDGLDGTYRVLYASSQRLGCFLETHACPRVDFDSRYAELAEIEDEDDCWPPTVGAWPLHGRKRLVGRQSIRAGTLTSVAVSALGVLRRELAGDCVGTRGSDTTSRPGLCSSPESSLPIDLSDPDLDQALAIHHLHKRRRRAAVPLIELRKFDIAHRQERTRVRPIEEQAFNNSPLAAISHRGGRDCVKKI
jgi:hypothetical protein